MTLTPGAIDTTNYFPPAAMSILHDLRNPLAAIHVAAALITKSAAPARQKIDLLMVCWSAPP